MRRPLPLLLPLLLAACSYDPADLGPEELGAMELPIVNGTADAAHPAVGMLTTQGYGICTATLIGSRTVLTAAHCVVQEQNPPFTLFPQLGWSRDGSAPAVPASSVVYHPQYHNDVFAGLVHDVAVVRLGQPVTDVTPMQLARSAPAKGEPITLVGYGYTQDGASDTFGTKRRAQNIIGKVSALQIVFYGATGSVGNICSGDSGGPALVQRNGGERLAGIHSWGEGVCGKAEHDSRVDVHHDWIKQQAQGDLYDGPPPDSQPPRVQIVTPGAQSQVGPSFQVTVSAQDDGGVQRVELYIDGNLLDSRQQAPYAFPVANLPPGPHNLRAEAVDQAGHRASTLVSVQVSTNPSPPAPGQPSTNDNPAPGQPEAGQPMVGGCSVGRGSTAPAPLALLLLLLVLRRCR